MRSTSVDTACRAAAEILYPHRLELVEATRRLRFVQTGVHFGRTCFGYLSYGAEVNLTADAPESFLAVHAPLSGAAEVRTGDHRLVCRPGTACLSTPGRPLAIRFSGDCAMMTVRIEASSLETVLRDLVADPAPGPVEFSPRMDLTRGPARSWWQLVWYLVGELERDSGLLTQPQAADNFERTLTTSLLLAQPSNYSGLIRLPSPRPSHRPIRRAVELVEQRPQSVMTATALAREVGISVRSLYTGFRRCMDTTPAAYIRRVRLQHARAELQDAEPGGGLTVARVAVHWGFAHLGDFAAAYRKRYGEHPSTTLRREPSTFDRS
ncbi:MAG: AraC family transcriptional regulator [Stackebrandtia sp.]